MLKLTRTSFPEENHHSQHTELAVERHESRRGHPKFDTSGHEFPPRHRHRPPQQLPARWPITLERDAAVFISASFLPVNSSTR